ncbi:cytochrome P450 [Lentzea flava]|uniref:cytochrome P450 n=1 Tax=Lentzea flava TaxID=103732 RepID=UPI001E2D0BA2|nr:cytochrome P450 [Lentzea flava]
MGQSETLTVHPVPGRHPVHGHAKQLHLDPLGFVRSLREHGDLVRIFIGPRPAEVVTTPELVRKLLVAYGRDFDKGALGDELCRHLGEGLVTSAGRFHIEQRRLMQPAFRAPCVAGYSRVMSAHSEEVAHRWQPGQILDLERELAQLTLDILMEIVFGPHPPSELVDAVGRWLSACQEAMKLALSAREAWRRLLPWSRFPRSSNPHAAVLRDILTRTIEQQRRDPTDNLLSTLLAARGSKTGEGMSDESLHDELRTLFVAGTGTLSAALAWTVHAMITHPEVARKVYAEVDTVIGSGSVTVEHVSQLVYTTQVIKEVLRRHSVWILMRRAMEPVQVKGITVAKGRELYYSPHALHHDPELYPEPEEFRPDRWTPEFEGALPRCAYVPFGVGNRICLGESFAWTELLIVIATIATRWRFELEPGHEVRTRIGTVDRPQNLVVVPTLREDRGVRC